MRKRGMVVLGVLGVALVIVAFNSTTTLTRSPRDITPTGRDIAESKASINVPPAPSPGLLMGYNSWDMQHYQSMGYQTARTAGADIVHFAWTENNWIPTYDPLARRNVAYSAYQVSTGSWLVGGVFVGLGGNARAGFSAGDVDDANRFNLALFQRQDPLFPYHTWRLLFPTPGSAAHIDNELTSNPFCDEALYPQVAISRNASGSDIVHIVSACGPGGNPPEPETENTYIYWRYNGAIWQGPVELAVGYGLGYALAADANSDRVCFAFHAYDKPDCIGMRNVAYFESANEGGDWLDGTGLQPEDKQWASLYYRLANAPQAGWDIAATYDNSGNRYIMWTESRSGTSPQQTAIRYRRNSTYRTVGYGYWDNPVSNGRYDRNLSKLTLGVGDGATSCGGVANDKRLYVLYTQFGGLWPAERDDHSSTGFMNGELYLTVSDNNYGLYWSPPINLTNTKTPDCYPGIADTLTGHPEYPDLVCRSEHWASIGRTVHDIDVVYVSDLDAGAAVLGEGTWQLNEMKYLRLPGGTADAPYLCPASAPNFAVVCPTPIAADNFTLSPGEIIRPAMRLENLGTASVDGSISVTMGTTWLSALPTGPFSFSSGQGRLDTVRIDATGLSPGTYHGEIEITHTDPTKPSPYVCGVDIVVRPGATCPLELAFNGESPGDKLGDAVGGAGDIDGDGFDDVIVGTLRNDAGGSDAGRAYVYSGQSGALLLTLTGETAGDYFGSDVAGVGDVNGDNVPDLFVAAVSSDAGGTDAGRAYVCSGTNGDHLLTFTGVTGDRLGSSIDGIGDVNGDAVPDLIVGAPYNDAGGLDAGCVYVYSGATGDPLHGFVNPVADEKFGAQVSAAGDVDADGVPDIAVVSNVGLGRVDVYSGQSWALLHTFPESGLRVAGAGDVNADGFDDIVVGNWSGNDPIAGDMVGQAYVYSGLDGQLLYTFAGQYRGDLYGSSVAGIGDINNDGFDDVAVGAYANDAERPAGYNVGRVFVYSGASGLLLHTFAGEAGSDNFGYDVSGAGDINNDGMPDLIVSATANDAGGIDAGRVYVYTCLCSGDDTDGDGIADVCDNCPSVYNPTQSDIDHNGIGDACQTPNTPVGTGVVVEVTDELTVIFSQVTTAGLTAVSSSSEGPSSSTGFILQPSGAPVYYEVQTTAEFVPPVELCFTYDPALDPWPDCPFPMRLVHFNGTAWVDVTSAWDCEAHLVCGMVTSLSPFALAESVCDCPCKYDPSCDGVVSDVLDVVQAVGVAFRGLAAIQDPNCPAQRTDVNNDGGTDVLDVVKIVNVAFRGQVISGNYVDPCGD